MTSGEPVTLRSIALTAFVPPALFSVGQGAIAPVVVITATRLGANPAQAALVVAIAGVGQLVADLPAGALAARVGDRRAMVAAGGITCLALVVCMWAPNLPAFAAAMFATGMGTAVWQLARQAYVAQAVPYQLRARAMSTLGGVYRIGLFVGPFLGGVAVAHTGLWAAYAVHLVACVVAVAVLLLAPDVTAAAPAGAGTAGSMALAREHRRTFSTLGVGVLLVSAIRATRQVVIPLWGQFIGLSPGTIAVVFGVSGAVDMLLFYPAGRAMDRWGRVAGAVPAMTILAVGHVLVPFTHSAGTLMAVGVLMGVGNGASSGLVMTLGADLAPPADRARFLGIWRLLADSGAGAGPLVLSGVTAVASLGVGVGTFGAVGILTAALMARWIPRRSPEVRAGD
ncbi:MFS transporter [Nakamurella deserti]|uniref:MFS transporter n=1 Tax=Nakamurella deserti TaxID=2164074 RepID=UPI000DBE0CFE|nr:MFS transporter [Nakamurella deserti]